MRTVLTADVGSTFTKLTAVDLDSLEIIGRARAFTTIETNVMEGLRAAEAEIKAQCGRLPYEARLASSSAAGGLKMVAIGLVPDLTAQAARLAAANAGAKVLKTYAYQLSRSEIGEIVDLKPDMLLLCGGLDGGNQEVITHNARHLAESSLNCPIVAAGNKSAADDLKDILDQYPGEVIFKPNVMPAIDTLNIEPAQAAIRDLFIRNIISAKGLDELQSGLSAEIIPTPLAVLKAAALLSRGLEKTPGLGDLMVFDVGGATTDVYSLAEGLPTRNRACLRGFREPWAKRTVEGDLGLRYSLPSLIEAAGADDIARRLGIDENEVEAWALNCGQHLDLVPEAASLGQRIDQELAAEAVRLSMARHCGRLETVYTIEGPSFVQTGKDLSEVLYVIGTGGPIINSPALTLKGALRGPEDIDLLKPVAPKLLVDRKYILSAMGLLSQLEPEAALALMMAELPAGELVSEIPKE